MPKKFLKILFVVFLTYFSLQLASFLILAPQPARADESLPKLTMPNFQINIPTVKLTAASSIDCKEKDAKGNIICKIPWIGEYIAGVYKYAIGIVGILATVVMMVGGIIWLTAGGNATRVGEAKAWIGASLTGLIIALSSYMILYQINPELIKLKPIKVAVVKEIKTPTTGCLWKKVPEEKWFSSVDSLDCGTGYSYSDSSKCPEKTEEESAEGDLAYNCCCSTGNCQPATTGSCTETNLNSTCFKDNTYKASAICMAESSGSETVKNSAATCNYNGQQYYVVLGLFQINISANDIVDNSGNTTTCSLAFDKAYSNSSTNCNITNFGLYSDCYNKMLNGNNNIVTACNLSSNGNNWKLWEANSDKCHF